jgi:curved DNA-binding protein CbpA
MNKFSINVSEIQEYHVKKKNDYLRIFGLAEPFTEEELSGAYRTLAKLNHPDLSNDPTAEMRMVILNEGYSYLKDHITTQPVKQKSEGPEDYRLYRAAVDVLREAFDLYYTGKLNENQLKTHLRKAKESLSLIVKNHEKSDWYFDSIDRIVSINKWLD